MSLCCSKSPDIYVYLYLCRPQSTCLYSGIYYCGLLLWQLNTNVCVLFSESLPYSDVNDVGLLADSGTIVAQSIIISTWEAETNHHGNTRHLLHINIDRCLYTFICTIRLSGQSDDLLLVFIVITIINVIFVFCFQININGWIIRVVSIVFQLFKV